MRQYVDAKGWQITLESISARDAYSGLIEGSPWMARKLRLMQSKSAMSSGGVYVHDLEALEQEIETLPRNTDIWAPAEAWSAHLIGFRDWTRRVELVLQVRWFQNQDDPFERLRAIIAVLDFRQYAKETTLEYD